MTSDNVSEKPGMLFMKHSAATVAPESDLGSAMQMEATAFTYSFGSLCGPSLAFYSWHYAYCC